MYLMLRTKRLLLRPVRADEGADLFDIYGDAETMRFWDSLPDPDLAASRIRAERLAVMPDPIHYLGLEHDRKLIGTAGVHARDEIGFILNRAYWRKGLMREALDTLIPWLFNTQGYNQLTADADPNNIASVACLRSLGFKQTGSAINTFCVNGVWSDSVYFRRDASPDG